MTRTVSVAVLIVNFRGYGDLDRCLESLGPYLRPRDQVIVADNESDPRQLEAVVARYPWITAIPSVENLGFARAINLAARQTEAEFLWLLNPDTIVEGPALRVMEDWLSGHPGTAVVGPHVLNRDGSTQPSARAFPGVSTILGGRSSWLTRHLPNNWWSRRNLLGLDATDPVDVDWISGSCLMTRRETFERLGGLDELFFIYCEDVDYCKRIAAAGDRCTYLPSVMVRHFGGGSAKYNLPRAIRAFHESAFRYYWKYSGVLGRLCAPFVRVGLYARGELLLHRAFRGRKAGTAAASLSAGMSASIPGRRTT
jgi:GT2 family glycosyltransferase